MKTKDVWYSEEWNLFNEIDRFFGCGCGRNDIVSCCSWKVELLIWVKYELSHILKEVASHNSSIVVVGDSSTVHCFTNEVSQSFPWELFLVIVLCLIQVHRYQLLRDLVIWGSEVVIDVPSNLAEFLSLLNDGMEEGKDVKHWPELRLWTIIEDILAKSRICVLDVLTKTIWRLSNDLKWLLKDTKWELVSWRGC